MLHHTLWQGVCLLRYQQWLNLQAIARFLHLFKFGLVVYGASNAPKVGGNREIPAYFLSIINSSKPTLGT